MDLHKIDDKIILENDNKKLHVSVEVNGNLDFYMYLRTSRVENSASFIIDDKNPEIYFITSSLFEDLVTEYKKNEYFYKSRYDGFPVYNEKHEMFKFHCDDSNVNDNNFTRFFRKDGKYYIVFNKDNKTLRLSNSGSRYPNFVRYFNNYYSSLVKHHTNSNFINGNKIKRFEEQKNG